MNIKKIWYRFKAKKGLIKKYNLDIEIDEILKDYISECIIARKQEFRRKELVEQQNKLNEDKLFLKWLKARKIF